MQRAGYKGRVHGRVQGQGQGQHGEVCRDPAVYRNSFALAKKVNRELRIDSRFVVISFFGEDFFEYEACVPDSPVVAIDAHPSLTVELGSEELTDTAPEVVLVAKVNFSKDEGPVHECPEGDDPEYEYAVEQPGHN